MYLRKCMDKQLFVVTTLSKKTFFLNPAVVMRESQFEELCGLRKTAVSWAIWGSWMVSSITGSLWRAAVTVGSLAFKLWKYPLNERVGIVQSVLTLSTDWTVRGTNPHRDKTHCLLQNRPDGPWGPSSLLFSWFFPGRKVARAFNWPLAPTYQRR